ncbi:MAG: enoyl-CoA hydratase/isomerase family protein [Burkholderiales bacterium]|nr:enoyl-CoA hydratase/isomerase family protein [Burkholderiales bacterium]
MSDLVLIEKHENHAVLTLNRPDKRNAVNIELADAIIAALTELEEVPVIVVTGAGDRAFCAGVDLKERKRTWSTSLGVARGQYWVDVNEAIRKHPSVFIAAVNGFALGGGLTLVNNCELAVAADSATFGMPELSFGVFPGLAGPTTMRRILPKHAAQMIFTAQRIDAQTALRWGIINEVVEPQRLLQRANELAAAVGQWSNITLGFAKRAYRELTEKGWADGIDYANHITSLIVAQRTLHPSEGASS